MKNVFLLGIIATIFITSCKKEKSVTSSINYTPLTIGNYWVYKNYSIDTLGNETILSGIDSVVIDRDTIIRGKAYLVFEGTNYPIQARWGIVSILRDSLDYLVNEKGEILFSKNNLSDILHEEIRLGNTDTLYTLRYQMENVNGSISVPAGTFNDVLNYKGTLYTYNSILVNNPRYLNNYYVPDVGRIVSTWYYLSSPTIFEKRLVNYNVQ